MPPSVAKKTRSGGGSGSRTIHDLSVDLTSIERSLHPAMGEALDLAASLVLDDAQSSTPVDTGFMRSRWRKDKKSQLKYSVSNDTWYLPIVNTSLRHAGFAEHIAERAHSNIKLAFEQLEFSQPSVTGKRAELGLSADVMRALMEVQIPMREALRSDADL